MAVGTVGKGEAFLNVLLLQCFEKRKKQSQFVEAQCEMPFFFIFIFHQVWMFWCDTGNLLLLSVAVLLIRETEGREGLVLAWLDLSWQACTPAYLPWRFGG